MTECSLLDVQVTKIDANGSCVPRRVRINHAGTLLYVCLSDQADAITRTIHLEKVQYAAVHGADGHTCAVTVAGEPPLVVSFEHAQDATRFAHLVWSAPYRRGEETPRKLLHEEEEEEEEEDELPLEPLVSSSCGASPSSSVHFNLRGNTARNVYTPTSQGERRLEEEEEDASTRLVKCQEQENGPHTQQRYAGIANTRSFQSIPLDTASAISSLQRQQQVKSIALAAEPHHVAHDVLAATTTAAAIPTPAPLPTSRQTKDRSTRASEDAGTIVPATVDDVRGLVKELQVRDLHVQQLQAELARQDAVLRELVLEARAASKPRLQQQQQRRTDGCEHHCSNEAAVASASTREYDALDKLRRTHTAELLALQGAFSGYQGRMDRFIARMQRDHAEEARMWASEQAELLERIHILEGRSQRHQDALAHDSHRDRRSHSLPSRYHDSSAAPAPTASGRNRSTSSNNMYDNASGTPLRSTQQQRQQRTYTELHQAQRRPTAKSRHNISVLSDRTTLLRGDDGTMITPRASRHAAPASIAGAVDSRPSSLLLSSSTMKTPPVPPVAEMGMQKERIFTPSFGRGYPPW